MFSGLQIEKKKVITMGQDARLHSVTPFLLFALLSAKYL